MTTAELLDRAADIKEGLPHIRYTYSDGAGAICMYSALELAESGRLPNLSNEHESLALRAGFDSERQICEFNNGHNKEECVQEFRRRAELARCA